MRCLVPALLLAAACGERAPSASLATPHIDTLAGGIVRVRNDGPSAWADTNGWKLVLERTIQPAEGEPGMLANPRGVASLANGEIAVFEGKPATVKVYGPDGAFRRTVGREGAGPGEFGPYSAIQAIGDTIVVHDREHGRIVLFGPDGAHLRTFPGGRMGFAGVPVPRDGTIPSQTYLEQRATTDRDRFPGMGVIRYRTDGKAVDSILFPPEAVPKLWSWKDATHDLGAYIPFMPEQMTSLDREAHVISGDQATYRLVTSRGAHDTLRIVEAPSTPVAVPDSIRRAEFASVLKHSAWVAERGGTLADVPTQYPAWIDFRTDGAGNLWVIRPGPKGPGDRFDVFDPTGRLLGAVPAPFGTVDDSWWTADRVIRLAESDDGAAKVEVWRIAKP